LTLLKTCKGAEVFVNLLLKKCEQHHVVDLCMIQTNLCNLIMSGRRQEQNTKSPLREHTNILQKYKQMLRCRPTRHRTASCFILQANVYT